MADQPHYLYYGAAAANHGDHDQNHHHHGGGGSSSSRAWAAPAGLTLKKYVKLGYHQAVQQGVYVLLLLVPLLLTARSGSRGPEDEGGAWMLEAAARSGVETLHRSMLRMLGGSSSSSSSSDGEMMLMVQQQQQQQQQLPIQLLAAMATIGCSLMMMMVATVTMMRMRMMGSRGRKAYMVEFACYLAEEEDKCSNAEFLRYSRATGAFNERSLEVQRRICERSGLGDETYLPPAVISEPPRPCMAEARAEAERVMFGAVDGLLARLARSHLDIAMSDVGVLVVNCSLFVPTPSLSSLLARRYRLRDDVKSFNLGGMGCSAGVIAIDLARRVLASSSSSSASASTALVVSMENITLNWYWGNDTSKLVSNCIFRMGGAAILLSSKPRIGRGAKYELVHAVRTHKGGSDDKAFRCVFQEEDERMNVGVSLSKELMAIAGSALRANITSLGPLVLPLSEQLLFLFSLALRRLRLSKPDSKPYVPDFKRAFEHFCIHAGGRAVLDELEKSLDLSDRHMEPSRMTLFRFGNTSSSSLWYELAYAEAKGRIRKGDRIWQIAFGSGFKCNSAVWKALRSVPPKQPGNPWTGFIDNFPVTVPTMRNLASTASEDRAAAAADPRQNHHSSKP